MLDLIRFILSKDFEAAHFKKSEFFLISARNLARGGWKIEYAWMLEPRCALPNHIRREGAPASLQVAPVAYGSSSTL